MTGPMMRLGKGTLLMRRMHFRRMLPWACGKMRPKLSAARLRKWHEFMTDRGVRNEVIESITPAFASAPETLSPHGQ